MRFRFLLHYNQLCQVSMIKSAKSAFNQFLSLYVKCTVILPDFPDPLRPSSAIFTGGFELSVLQVCVMTNSGLLLLRLSLFLIIVGVIFAEGFSSFFMIQLCLEATVVFSGLHTLASVLIKWLR